MTKWSVNRGKQLKLAREYRGYTQTHLADKIEGLSQSNLSKFEKGFEGQIKDSKLLDIMKFLDWPINWLNVTHPIHNKL